MRDRMQATGMMDVCGRRFVLTGGGSELTGLPELGRRILGRNVRNGRPMGIYMAHCLSIPVIGELPDDNPPDYHCQVGCQ